jgi:hypothetical protein
MWSGNLRKDLVNSNKEAPGDEIPGLLRCGLAGGIRTHDRAVVIDVLYPLSYSETRVEIS